REERPLRRGVEIFEKADDVVVPDHGAHAGGSAPVPFAVQLAHLVGDRRGTVTPLLFRHRARLLPPLGGGTPGRNEERSGERPGGRREVPSHLNPRTPQREKRVLL